MLKDIKRLEVAELERKRIAIIGFGLRTGVALADFLWQHQADLVIYDSQPRTKLRANLDALLERNAAIKAEFHLGDNNSDRNDRSGDNLKWLENVDLLVASPGVPVYEPTFVRARSLGIPIIGELEFSSWYVEAPLLAVTGSNGKTTTCWLLSQLLQFDSMRTFLGGNYGTPLVEAVHKDWDVIISETSSFQLETTCHFRPYISTLLNISDNHLDRHGTLDNYTDMKARIFRRQQPGDWAVVNGDDVRVMACAKRTKAQVVSFSLENDSQHAVYHDANSDEIVVKLDSEQRYTTQTYAPQGRHNLQNLMAVIAMATILRVDPERIRQAIGQMRAPRHRLELVATRAGVTFVNDSKSTSIDSTIKALACYERPVVLILGGKDKGADYSLLRSSVHGRAKALVYYGETAARMQQEIDFSGPQVAVEKFEDALKATAELAQEGDIVLLSPAASSLDQFANYEARGDYFCSFVREGVPEGGLEEPA